MKLITQLEIQNILEKELEKLKRLLNVSHELKVVWLPDNNSTLSGEVKGETIYFYDEKEELAVETLRHEFLDYAISKVIEPYKEVTNKLIIMINEQAYRRKERLVDSLCQIIRGEVEQ